MIVYLILFISSFTITYGVKYVATKKRLIDVPNERSSHSVPTPRGGGIAIAVTWFVGVFYMYFVGNLESNLFFALLSGLLLAIVSLLDDIYNLKSTPRLVVQALTAFSALYFLGGLEEIDLGFIVFENFWLMNILTFIGIIWFINLYNFIDGIDGYAATETIFVATTIFVLTGHEVSLLLAVATLGFLPWNWSKAKIFMGDIGSTLLGFNLVVFAIYFQNEANLSLINWLILTSVFWFDATYTIIRRLYNKEKITQPHKKHLFQRITQAGFSHHKTVLSAMAINLLFIGIVVISVTFPEYILLCFLFNILILLFITKKINKRKPFNV